VGIRYEEVREKNPLVLVEHTLVRLPVERALIYRGR
jgi:hypothetical protein